MIRGRLYAWCKVHRATGKGIRCFACVDIRCKDIVYFDSILIRTITGAHNMYCTHLSADRISNSQELSLCLQLPSLCTCGSKQFQTFI